MFGSLDEMGVCVDLADTAGDTAPSIGANELGLSRPLQGRPQCGVQQPKSAEASR